MRIANPNSLRVASVMVWGSNAAARCMLTAVNDVAKVDQENRLYLCVAFPHLLLVVSCVLKKMPPRKGLKKRSMMASEKPSACNNITVNDDVSKCVM
jgi:hypothetical protein